MDVYDIIEECMELMKGMERDKLLDVVHHWFGGERDVEILVDICQDGLFDQAEKDEARIREFHEYLKTTRTHLPSTF